MKRCLLPSMALLALCILLSFPSQPYAATAIKEEFAVYNGTVPVWNIESDLYADANDGDSEAQYIWATHQEDIKDKVKWLLKAAQNGHMLAQRDLANILVEGFGEDIPKNPQDAMLWYKKAAVQGEPWSQLQTAINILKVNKNSFKESTDWLMKAAQHVHMHPAQYYLGLIALCGGFAPENEKTAATYLHEEFLHYGQVEQTGSNLEMMFSKAQPAHIAEAEKWFRMAMRQNNPYATTALGYILCNKKNATSAEMAEGLALLNKPAGAYGANYYFLGKLYLEGKANVQQDKDIALAFIRKAAKANDPHAQSLLTSLKD